MGTRQNDGFSRRERQIIEILYRLEEASAQQVLEELPDAPSYSAVRALLRIMEDKGHVRHRRDGPRYLYSPRRPRERASRSLLANLVKNFFGDSSEEAFAALLDLKGREMSDGELARLERMVRQARKAGR